MKSTNFSFNSPQLARKLGARVFHESTAAAHPCMLDDVDDINTPDIDPSFFADGPQFKKIKMEPMDNLTRDEPMDLLDDWVLVPSPSRTEARVPSSGVPETPDDEKFNNIFDIINKDTLNDEKNRSVFITSSQPSSLEQNPVFASPNEVCGVNVTSNSTVTVASTSVANASQVVPILMSVAPTVTAIHVPSISGPTATPVPEPVTAISAVAQVGHFVTASSSSSSSSPGPVLHYLEPANQRPSEFQCYNGEQVDYMHLVGENSCASTSSSSEQPFDHIYSTLPSSPMVGSTLKRKNNEASKKSRVGKREKQRQMEELERNLRESNGRMKIEITQLEKQIDACKRVLINRVAGQRT